MPETKHYNFSRIRYVNGHEFNQKGSYVHYWMQIYRRLDYNHALNYALACSERWQKPLVLYEGLKLNYPWASQRLHQFILQGMLDNKETAKKLGLNYWPFVETPDDSGRGLLRKLAKDAVAVVTDDFPAFIIPGHTSALADKTDTPVIAIDGNSLVPLSLLGKPISAAAHLRPRVHKAFAEAWEHRSGLRPEIPKGAKKKVDPAFDLWDTKDLGKFIETLPLDKSVPPIKETPGGATEAKNRLIRFLNKRLPRYAEDRSQPLPPEESPASGLSPYLHFGHISIEEIVQRVLETTGDWSLEDLSHENSGKREGFFCNDANVNSFLDEAIVWRDVGFQWHWHRREDTKSLEAALPEWAWQELTEHKKDKRDYLYSPEEWEAGETHDELWNAAQRELVATGVIHNYLRMLWGKKVIEWSATPEEAYSTLEHLNNKYALDGRNPNSYTGILWCFGLFDRPWPSNRKGFGRIRYMSSDSTRKKFKIQKYMDYIETLPTISEVRNRK